MILAVGTIQALAGGLSAVLGPEMLLVGFALACGAAVAASRERGVRADLVLGLCFVLAVASVWIRADLVPPARFSRWLALVPLLGLVEIRRLRSGHEDWTIPAIAVCVAGLVLFWRIDRYGPVLATLRGDWQEPLGYAARSLYHIGTALGLAAVFVALVAVIRRLPARVRLPLSWALLGLGVVFVLFDLVAPAQRWLLLHGPPMSVG